MGLEEVEDARRGEIDDEMRKIEYICRVELQAIRELLSLDNDPVALARHIGIARLSRQGRQRLIDTMEP